MEFAIAQLQHHVLGLVQKITYKVHRELIAVGLAHRRCRLCAVNIHWMKLPSIINYVASGFFTITTLRTLTYLIITQDKSTILLWC
jgi:hypothetical protein